MSIGFDLGGFMGGIIGTLGAYWVARYTIKKQREAERPKQRKTVYVCASRVGDALYNFSWEIVLMENTEYGPLFEKMIQFRGKLLEMLPEAIETDDRLVVLIERVRTELFKLGNHYSKIENRNDYGKFLKDVSNILDKEFRVCKSIMTQAKGT
ncbi:hypothetical protein H7B90_00760 [Cohnella xylanilytica]|uniref:Uncharacterized protein n=1 Tax=Cohnella xylanilytica TaxID=557555 RepID=A0A841TSV2_9BACL|nr:hypothetical protein [Cohnella xylanilytica]MBB6689922.1 hypothetical protein [Cohnella xylanilytica]